MSDFWLYVILSAIPLAFVFFEAFGGREWWAERKCRKAPYWKKYFEDIEAFRRLKESAGYYSGPDDYIIDYRFRPERIVSEIASNCDSWCTPDIYLNLYIYVLGGLEGWKEESKGLAKRNLVVTDIKAFKFYGRIVKIDEN